MENIFSEVYEFILFVALFELFNRGEMQKILLTEVESLA